MKLIRTHQVMELTGLSRTTLWRLERQDRFPRRRRIGPNAVAWLEDEIEAWIESRPFVSAVTPDEVE